MITAIFNPGDKSVTTEKLLQWDYGQVLSIKGLDLPKAVEIHFCVYTDSTTITTVGITTDDHTDVEIPDGLLQQERELRAYVYVADLEQGKTVRTVNIPIQSRQKPEIPHTPEDTEVFREAIKAVNDSADRAETAANTSEQNAKKTAEDRKTIEEMVETVSGIEQQVQDVKKYAGQAETAASNAALSEQKAKESETATLQAKADAETAKGSAETAAGKTAEDRTAVESAKEEVLQAKQQVSADRAAVEAVERKVAQMGNAIPQAVLEGVQAVKNAGAAEKQGIVQAGSEQKSAVESTGTKAVEDIVLAKKTATDAVETAKTGAVGAVGTAGTEQTQNVTAEGEKQVKAVADKGAEVLQSIPEDFVTQMESKLDKKQGVENAGKAMVINPEGVIVPGEVTGGDGIPIINTASGGSPLVVSDSAERVNKGFSIIGNTEQLTTTGANLFDEKKLLNFDDPNYDKSSAGKGVFYYKFKTDEQVTVSVTKLNKDGEYLCVGAEPDGSDAHWLSHKSAAANTFRTLTPKDGYIYLGVNTTLERVENMIRKTGGIMINHGSVAMPYEPYTGGKPSPSPDYPQEIKNVGKWNEEKRKYEVDVRVTGKNLFNIKSNRMQIYNCTIQEDGSVKSNINNHYYSYINITDSKILENIKNGQTITFSIDKGIPKKALSIIVNDGKRVLEKSSSAGECFVTLAVSGIGKVKSLELRFNRSNTRFTGEAIVKDLMLCYGEVTEYQPYKEQAITFQMPNGLLGIPVKSGGNYIDATGQQRICDEIDFERGKYVQRVWKKTFDGSDDEDWIAYNTNPYEGFTITILPEEMDKRAGFCNLLIVKEKVESVESIVFGIGSNNIYCIASSLYDSSLEDKGIANWKAHLSKTPMEVMTYLTTPIEYDLSSEEIEKYKALYTYYPTTVITVDGGEVDPDVEVTYIADTKNYIDQKIAAIGKTVVETQKALL